MTLRAAPSRGMIGYGSLAGLAFDWPRPVTQNGFDVLTTDTVQGRRIRASHLDLLLSPVDGLSPAFQLQDRNQGRGKTERPGRRSDQRTLNVCSVCSTEKLFPANVCHTGRSFSIANKDGSTQRVFFTTQKVPYIAHRMGEGVYFAYMYMYMLVPRLSQMGLGRTKMVCIHSKTWMDGAKHWIIDVMNL